MGAFDGAGVSEEEAGAPSGASSSRGGDLSGGSTPASFTSLGMGACGPGWNSVSFKTATAGCNTGGGLLRGSTPA
eukprot:15387136-Alexandrium_andersonii.AAC.1